MGAWAIFSDEDLIARARERNQELITALRPLVTLYEGADAAEGLVDIERAQRRAATLYREITSLQEEIARRRIPHPNGATIVNTVTVGDRIDVGDISNATGVAVGRGADSSVTKE